jgi:putative flippase GtrA
MLHTAVLAAFEYSEHELPIPAIVYGIIGAVVFIFLGAVTWSYKDVSRRHHIAADPDAAQHMTSTGSESHRPGHPGQH